MCGNAVIAPLLMIFSPCFVIISCCVCVYFAFSTVEQPTVFHFRHFSCDIKTQIQRQFADFCLCLACIISVLYASVSTVIVFVGYNVRVTYKR